MKEYFNLILRHQEKIKEYNLKIDSIKEKIEELNHEYSNYSNQDLNIVEKLEKLAKKEKERDIENFLSTSIILIFLFSLILSFWNLTNNIIIPQIFLNVLKSLAILFSVNAISIGINKLLLVIAKKYFENTRNKNKLEIEQLQLELDKNRTKELEISKKKSDLILDKYHLQELIKSENEQTIKINNVLLDELAPYLDKLIEKELNTQNTNIKEAMDNITLKLQKEGY